MDACQNDIKDSCLFVFHQENSTLIDQYWFVPGMGSSVIYIEFKPVYIIWLQ